MSEIEIIKGHDSSSYFWIMPVKYKKNSKKTNFDDYWNDWQEIRKYEISIEESDVSQYLSYFLFKHFDINFQPNANRYGTCNPNIFEWYLEYNFYTYEHIQNMINDIKTLINILESKHKDLVNIVNKQFPPQTWFGYSEINLGHNLVKTKINTIKEIKNFYNKFCIEMENIIQTCKTTNIISFMGP